MNLFRLDASVRGGMSVSRSVADTAEAAWRRGNPEGQVVRRDLVTAPVPAYAWAEAVGASMTAEEERTVQQREAQALAGELADELVAADAYLFALPLYNYGVSQHVKAWIDLILTDPRLSVGGSNDIADRPAVLAISRGGGYGPGTPREGWDHATPYYRRIFGDVLGLRLHVSEVELTLAEISPAMESLRGLARESLDAGHAAAETFGQLLAEHAPAR